jgi:hypothetical protein
LEGSHGHKLFHRGMTLGTIAQRLIGNLLLNFKNFVTLLAFVLVNWHFVFTYDIQDID